MGVGTLLGQSDELLAASARAAHERGWAVHTHLAEVREEVVQARMRWGRSAVERSADAGLLEVPVLAAHCLWVDQVEVAALARAGVAAVHNPVANMILASGVCPVPALRAAGMVVALGTDGAASNDSQNLLEAVKVAALLQKLARLDARALTAGDVLTMATIDGARALSLAHRGRPLVRVLQDPSRLRWLLGRPQVEPPNVGVPEVRGIGGPQCQRRVESP